MKSRKRKQLNKREHFKWGVDQQNSLDALISHPTIPTVIAFVDYAQPFILHTDASSSGLGAVMYPKCRVVQKGSLHMLAEVYGEKTTKLISWNFLP